MKGLWFGVRHLIPLLGSLALAGCGDRKKASSDNLADAGYQLTATDWFRAVADDNPPVLEMFLKGGFQIGSRTPEGNGALHIAAASGAMKSGKFLLDHKVGLDDPGEGGRTPLMESIRTGQLAMMRWLLKQGANPLSKDTEGYKPLMLAVKEGRAEAIGDLAVHDREDLDAALLAAALLGQTKVIDELTKYGASIYARMDDGRTALMVAAENGHLDSSKLLIDIGSNRFTTDPEGRTASDLASAAGHQEVVKLLSAQPTAGELALQSNEQIGDELASVADAAQAGGAPAVSSPAIAEGTGEVAQPSSGGSAPKATGRPVSLEGQTLGAITGAPASSPAESSPEPASRSVGLVMRSFRQRELPIEVSHVKNGTATMKLRGTPPREIRVSEGQTVPGSRLKVIGLRRKMHSGKENFGKLTEVSVVELEDSATGVRREFIAGVPASAHDPLALVEDSSTGRRFLAAPGQRFTASDGTSYTVSDVRPNQIVLVNSSTGATQTLPLRGPRG
jgi:ankyrin repeat protein